MSVSTKVASIPRVERFVDEKPEVSEEMRFAQNTWLSELPGLIFGLMTIVYIVAALYSLA